MKFQWIRSHTDEFPAQVACRVLGVSRSGYYAWMRRKPSKRRAADAELTAVIREVFTASRETYGSPRVTAVLTRQGVSCGKNRVARLMSESGLVSVRRRKFRPATTDSSHGLPVVENLLNQDFTTAAPNERWVGDITYVPTDQGFLYLAVILDLFSRRVIGWATSASPHAELTCRALDMAMFRRGKPGDLVYHSDRGSQYASSAFRSQLEAYGITASMSRTGNCYDNAVAESFFDTLKVECLHRYRFASRQGARTMIADFIEEFYNVNRSHSSLGFFSPAEYEEMHIRPPNDCVH